MTIECIVHTWNVNKLYKLEIDSPSSLCSETRMEHVEIAISPLIDGIIYFPSYWRDHLFPLLLTGSSISPCIDWIIYFPSYWLDHMVVKQGWNMSGLLFPLLLTGSYINVQGIKCHRCQYPNSAYFILFSRVVSHKP